MDAIAFIPARKGSKGLPGKNKKIFHGKPLIQHTIDQAKDSGVFDKILVSTDDEDILEIAGECEVDSHRRLDELGGDDVQVSEVLYDYFARQTYLHKYLCLLNPTSPLRTADDIAKSSKYIKMKKYQTVVSVQWHDWMGWIGKPSNQGPACTYNVAQRPNRQTRDDFFMENGSIYWCMLDVLIAYGNFIGNPEKAKLYEMSRERSFEIDTPFDWYMAERAYEYLQR
ncbi:acylneuraminate cytidylyltransferase family protein [Neptuniibacter sp.]|uniref:acylneuraminate cytidylyltransferase family protein n=1 Tax=Neptuniibacter sp. TaxID=1962643 RepID=UPI0026345BA4|nr:acylneuraminate cytidylyltransferase family protein [Neptuniibacter sp.]MCP4597063.1 acylneuraminate cytidylyltransferase family protein [Neptuniibacter sp.]